MAGCCLAVISARESHTTWQQYLGAADSSHYSSLRQINRANISKLQVAWSYPTGDDVYYSFNPIVVGNVMYVVAKNFSVVALDAATGREIWAHPTRSPEEPLIKGRGTWALRYRGMDYWQSKDGSDRRLLISVHDHLQEVDARTGKSIESFGDHGLVDLREGLGREPGSITQIQSGSPGRIFENLIILGSVTGEEYMSPPGDIRAYDVRTGKMAWIFHTVPHPGESGYDTWPKDAWKYIGGTNDWGGMSVDEKRGIVYVPTGSPTYDFYGADRKGDDLFSDCLLALDARTGKLIWHYQVTHHDLWDYDLASEPQLLTIRHHGMLVDVVAEASKNGFLYVFDRVTGKPVWPIEERSVPKSDMPGEVISPTQPFPTAPPPFARQTFTAADVDPYYLSPAEQDKWKTITQAARNEGLYTPPGLTDVVQMPGNHGGANWGSAAMDPVSARVYVVSVDLPAFLKLESRQVEGVIAAGPLSQQGHTIYRQNCQMCHGAERAGNPPAIPSLVDITEKLGPEGVKRTVKQGAGEMPSFPRMSEGRLAALVAYLANVDSGAVHPALDTDQGLPPPYPNGSDAPADRYWTGYGLQPVVIKPPWSTLTAYDLNRGTIDWQIPIGDAPEVARQGVQGTGVLVIRNGVAVTAGGLVFLATNEEGKLRAYDKDTGKLLWEVELPAASEGIPSIYEAKGKEYLVVCATSPKGPSAQRDAQEGAAPSLMAARPVHGSYIAYALPGKSVTAEVAVSNPVVSAAHSKGLFGIGGI
jgi:quinoprotein glucose dehydrogenase